MDIKSLSLHGVALVLPKIITDERGYFCETFREDVFCDAVKMDVHFVQVNQSHSRQKGTIRGLHYQGPPSAQGKLVQCIQGSITDVVVDIRKNSAGYGQHLCVDLVAGTGHQLWVPPGFLHGFVTRETDTVVQYRTTAYFDAKCEGRVAWDDPALAIDWELNGTDPTLSDVDAMALGFKAFITPFTGL